MSDCRYRKFTWIKLIYLEFEYPWQEEMNRLFVYQS